VGFVVVASLAFGVGGGLMKLSAGPHGAWPVIGAAALFVVGALLLTRAVRTEGLSVAYMAGLGIEGLVSVGIGRYVFAERLTPPQAIGLGLIAIGIASLRLG
jgi:multidrug transporter EmrE-like cation transporter